jgi:hypothetical protein
LTPNDLDARPVRRDELAQQGHEATMDPLQVSLTDENLLLRRYAQSHDPALREELCRRLLPLAQSLALRYRDASEQLDDLMQVASLGLVKALDGFDPTRGVPFSAYAAPTILGELRRAAPISKRGRVLSQLRRQVSETAARVIVKPRGGLTARGRGPVNSSLLPMGRRTRGSSPLLPG